MMHLTLYSRGYCHLCDDMLDALQRHPVFPSCTLAVLDVDADPLLVARYDERVPVLTVRDLVKGVGNGAEIETETEICHYFLDDAKLHQFAASFGIRGSASQGLSECAE